MSSPPARCALGLDVGNAKLKLCLLAPGAPPRWASHALPYTPALRYRRHEDFARGIPPLLERFLAGARPAAAVAVTSSGYAYPSYREGALHLSGLLREALPGTRAALLSGDGSAVGVDEVLAGDADLLGPLPFSNGMGAVHLARRLAWLGEAATGIVTDTGGSTTAVTPLVAGEVDPAAHRERARHLDLRIQHGKLTWIGLQTTPLEALAEAVEVGGRRYPVIPRGVTFDHVARLLELAAPARAERLSLFGLHPGRADALRAVADALNLDLEMASEDELLAAARTFHQLAVARLADGVRRALETAPVEARRRALAFGLGAPGLARPALELAGVPAEGIALGQDLLPPELAEAASCYGAAHLAAEVVVGEVLPVDPAELAGAW
ncbi:MAG: hypothetical protein AB7N76_01050 [Planctomycetota bacterium]